MDNSKLNAIQELGDELHALKTQLERAEVAMQEVSCEYFDAFDCDNADDIPFILHQFNRNRIFADIVVDCLFNLRNELKALNEASKVNAIATE